MKNWKTTVIGIFAGIPQIIQGITSDPINWSLVMTGVATIVGFFFAKDRAVTGGTIQQ